MLPLQPSQRSPTVHVHSTVVERVSTKRTTRATTALEPLEQTSTMERVLARTAPLIRHLPIWAHNTVTNRTLGLTLQRTLDVPPPCRQRIDQAAVEDGNRAERGA